MGRSKVRQYSDARADVRYQEFWYTDRGVKHLEIEAKKVLLELGCGYAEHGIWFAEQNPEWLVIGIDRKGDRLSTALKRAENLDSFETARMDVHSIDQFIPANSITEIWITFPDPYIKSPERGVVGVEYMKLYQIILRKKGIIRIKTDSEVVAATLSKACTELQLNLQTEVFAEEVKSRFQIAKLGEKTPFMFKVVL